MIILNDSINHEINKQQPQTSHKILNLRLKMLRHVILHMLRKKEAYGCITYSPLVIAQSNSLAGIERIYCPNKCIFYSNDDSIGIWWVSMHGHGIV